MKHVALSDIFKNILVKDSNNKNLKVKEKIFSIFTNVMFSAKKLYTRFADCDFF